MSVNKDSNAELTRAYEVSNGPGAWILSEPVIAATYPVAPEIRLQGTGNSVGCDLIDEDSELLNITRKYSRCPDSKYMPGKIGSTVSSTGVTNQRSLQKVNLLTQESEQGSCGQKPRISFPDCNLTTENTRLTTPLCTAQEQGYNRWDFLFFNPQENVSISFDHNINNDLLVKDNHRPCIPVPLDQSACFPHPQ